MVSQPTNRLEHLVAELDELIYLRETRMRWATVAGLDLWSYTILSSGSMSRDWHWVEANPYRQVRLEWREVMGRT